eukprot:771212_1
MLTNVLSKLSPKTRAVQNKDSAATKTEEYDVDKIIWTENIVSDLWIYIKNNNLLLGIFLSDRRHPFHKKRRVMIFGTYVSFIILISSLVSKYAFVCVEDPPNETSPKCTNRITILSCVMFILGIMFLHRFIKMIMKCAALGNNSNHRHNYFIGLILSFVSAQFIVFMLIISTIFLLKGFMLFIKVGEPMMDSVAYIVIILMVSLVYESGNDVYNFFVKRNIEIRANKIQNAQFDPHADIRGGQKKKNIYVA